MTALGFGCLSHPSGGARLRQAVTLRSCCMSLFLLQSILTHTHIHTHTHTHTVKNMHTHTHTHTVKNMHTHTHTTLPLQLFTLEMSQSNVEQIPIKTSAQWNFNESAHIWGTQLRKSVSHPCSTQRSHKLFPSASNTCVCARATYSRGQRVKKSESLLSVK